MPEAEIFNVCTAAEMSDRLSRKGWEVGADRLTELAKSGQCPHFTCGDCKPYFAVNATLSWFYDNMVQSAPGMTIRTIVKIPYSVESDEGRKDALLLPKCLWGISEQLVFRNKDTMGSGIYFLCKYGHVVYVGKSRIVSARLAQHIGEDCKDFDYIYVLPTPESELDELEYVFIYLLRPWYNGESEKVSERAQENSRIRIRNHCGVDLPAVSEQDAFEVMKVKPEGMSFYPLVLAAVKENQ